MSERVQDDLTCDQGVGSSVRLTSEASLDAGLDFYPWTADVWIFSVCGEASFGAFS
jgi:hypothetical protein